MAVDANLQCSLRESLGSRASRKLRAGGRIPASLQGEDIDNINLHLDADSFHAARRHHVSLFDLDIDGRVESAVVRELQWDAMGDHLVHIEFKRVIRGVETEAEVNLTFAGMPKEGVVNVVQGTITVRCIPSLIPEQIKFSVDGLEAGSHILAGSLEMPEGVSLGVDPETEVAVIAAIREESDEPAEIPDADAPAEDGPAPSAD